MKIIKCMVFWSFFKKGAGTLLLTSLFALSVLCPVFAESGDEIVAIVNNDIITANELNTFMHMADKEGISQLPSMSEEQMKKHFLERMVEDRLILQKAKEMQITIEDEKIDARIEEIRLKTGGEEQFQSLLAAEGITLNELRAKIRDQLLVYTVVNGVIRGKIAVSPKEVTDFYLEHRDQFVTPESLEADSIFVEDKETLLKVQDALGEGEDFLDLEKKFSKKERLGLVQRGQLKKDLEDVLFALQVDQCSNPVSLDGGYYIFVIRKKHEATVKKIEEVRAAIIAFLENKKMEMELKTWLEDIKETAYISMRL